ncbi:MAG: sterol desaturase family protein, partial [Sneathiella sp.]|nr:sterol desaturase family protein [Sneathiella sp.]
QNAGLPVTASAYLAVTIAAFFITCHELKFPYRKNWKPDGGEIPTDITFLVIIQVGLPFLLTASLVLYVAEVLHTRGWTIDTLWPHDWPVILQVILMVILAEFPRYWLHRGFHKYSALWRFHAVHHSSHKLYWLNVGRFHPVDKAAQFMVDALPFALLGLSPDVLAAYLVFYAINGFFQHSNCSIRLGFLNYIVSGPELHRWHHSKVPKESDHNFGNNLILWDVIFRTRYLPAGKQVGDLGLINRRYPMSFLAQMKTPFDANLDKQK